MLTIEQLNNHFRERDLAIEVTEISKLFPVTPDIVSKSTFLNGFSDNYFQYYVHARVNRLHDTLAEKYRKLFQASKNSSYNNAIAISFWKDEFYSAFPFFSN